MTNPNDSASPILQGFDQDIITAGLSKREHFAAMVLQGLLANSSLCQISMIDPVGELRNITKNCTELSVIAADRLISALNKEALHDGAVKEPTSVQIGPICVKQQTSDEDMIVIAEQIEQILNSVKACVSVEWINTLSKDENPYGDFGYLRISKTTTPKA